MNKRLNFNNINTEDCPCKSCHANGQSYVGCHSNCLKYIDWKQKHDIELANIRKQKEMDNLLFSNQFKRNKKLKQEGGLHYGRSNYDSR